MSEKRVNKRYAKSVIEQAREKDQLEQLRKDAGVFLEICRQNRDFLLMLRNPVIRSDKKVEIVRQVLEPYFHTENLNFVRLVIRKNRSPYLKGIFESVMDQYRELIGIYKATVYSPVELKDATREKIKKLLEPKGEKTVELENIVNEQLLGGLVLKYGDKLWDASVATRLKEMKKQLTA